MPSFLEVCPTLKITPSAHPPSQIWVSSSHISRKWGVSTFLRGCKIRRFYDIFETHGMRCPKFSHATRTNDKWRDWKPQRRLFGGLTNSFPKILPEIEIKWRKDAPSFYRTSHKLRPPSNCRKGSNSLAHGRTNYFGGRNDGQSNLWTTVHFKYAIIFVAANFYLEIWNESSSLPLQGNLTPYIHNPSHPVARYRAEINASMRCQNNCPCSHDKRHKDVTPCLKTKYIIMLNFAVFSRATFTRTCPEWIRAVFACSFCRYDAAELTSDDESAWERVP